MARHYEPIKLPHETAPWRVACRTEAIIDPLGKGMPVTTLVTLPGEYLSPIDAQLVADALNREFQRLTGLFLQVPLELVEADFQDA